MQKNIRNYIEMIDDLRREYNFTVENLCENIMSPRYYRRILSGERNISHKHIEKFCDRLEVSESDFYYQASVRDRTELKRIYTLYNMIYTRDYTNFMTEMKKIKPEKFTTIQNEKFFNYCLQRMYFVKDKVMKKDILINLYKLFDYPKSLDKKSFDFVDIHILMLIAEIQVKLNDETALNKLIDILNNRISILVSSESSHVMATVYANTALFLLRLKKYEESRNIATNGLEHSRKHNDVSSLAHLKYCKAYSNYKLGNKLEAEIDAIKCLSCSIAKSNKTEFDIFFNEFKKLFNMNPFDLFKKHDKDIF